MLLIIGLNFIKSDGYNPIWSHKGFSPVARPLRRGRRSKTAFLAFRTFLLRFGTSGGRVVEANGDSRAFSGFEASIAQGSLYGEGSESRV
jgi:hypothetical protein